MKKLNFSRPTYVTVTGGTLFKDGQPLVDVDGVFGPLLGEYTAHINAVVTVAQAQQPSNTAIPGKPEVTFTEVFSSRPSELGSWAWLWVLDTRKAPCITQPLARYYIYFAPDHETRSGVRLFYTNNLRDRASWVLYKGGPDPTLPELIYEDLDEGPGRPRTYSTETPSVVYDPIENKLRMWYHCVNPFYGNGSGPGGVVNLTDPSGSRSGCTLFKASQGTMSCLQADGRGVVFTKDRPFALDVYWAAGGHGYGDHTGYFVPFYVRGKWAAYHINGGSDSGSFGLSTAVGGDLGRWRSDKRQLSRYTHLFREHGLPNTMVGWNGCTVVDTKYGLKILGPATTPASGTNAGNFVLFHAPIAEDLRTITGPVEILHSNPPGTPVNWIAEDDGSLVGIYRTATTIGVCNVKY